MKARLLGLLMAVCMMTGAQAASGKSENGKKVLVAYFSWSGNTEKLARQIQELTGGDLFRIETVKDYPEEYRPCTEYAKKEKEADARPALIGKVKNLDRYDVVFVGFPNWWGTAPMAVWTFLEICNLDGKTVVPFMTHGGGGEQNCFSDFKKHTGKATVKKGFYVGGGQVGSAGPQVEAWLREIKMK